MNISIISPCYNVSKYKKNFDRLMRLVLPQLSESVELLLIDDCSTDDTFSVIQRLETENEFVRAFRTEENVKAGGARNLGMREAKGKYIAFVDSDDEIISHCFVEFSEMISKHSAMNSAPPPPDIYYAPSYWETDGKTMREVQCRRPIDSEEIDDALRADFVLHSPCVWNMLYRAEFLKNERCMFMEGKYYEDNNFVYKLMLKIRSAKSIKPYYIYCNDNAASITHIKNNVKILEDRFETTEDILKCWQSCNSGSATLTDSAVKAQCARLMNTNTRAGAVLMFSPPRTDYIRKTKALMREWGLSDYKKNRFYKQITPKKWRILNALCDVSIHAYAFVLVLYQKLKGERL